MAGGHAELHRAVYDRETARAARRWADRIGGRVVNEAKKRCPVDEGTLRASITHVVDAQPGKITVVVGSPLDYARYIHEGTGVHGPKGTPITPVTRQALKFKWDGPGTSTRSKDKRGYVFAKSVKGVKPTPFLADALEAVMGVTRRRTN